MKKLLISSIILSQMLIPVNAQTNEGFNLAGIIENIINYQTTSDFVSDVRLDSRDTFIYAMQNMNNGNVIVAYSEFEKTVNSLDKNISLLMLAKKLYELGFFSLGDTALSKISTQTKLQAKVEKLKNAYKPSYTLSKDEESYLAKAYTSIYFNNSPEEAAFNLVNKKVLMENSDYANYIMSLAMFECKQYNQALNYINRAIEKNNTNSNYKFFKAKILVEKGQLKDTIKYIDSIKDSIAVYFDMDLKILKEQAFIKNSEDELDKKFHQIYILYLEGNYYKVLKETQNALTFNKNNPKILSLQAMAHLSLGEKEAAYQDFLLSYKNDKKLELAIMGLADINFINGRYKEAVDFYKKLYNTELKKEAVIKTAAVYEIQNIQNKKTQKIFKMKDNIDKEAFYEYYLLANNIFSNDEQKQRAYIAKSLGINMLNVNSWDILLETSLKKNDFANLKKLVFMLSFLDLKNPEYYYYSALCLDNSNKKKDAYYEVKKAILISPDYKPAQDLINKLESELI